MKNRDGDSDVYDSVNFFGEIGLFRELPKADDITDWTPYTNIEGQSLKDETPQQEFEQKFEFEF